MGRHVISSRRLVRRAEGRSTSQMETINEMVTATINFAIATGRLKDKRAEREERDSSDNE